MWLERIAHSQRLLLEAYEKHLLAICGVTIGTCALFMWHVSVFLTATYGRRRPQIDTLRARDVTKYVLSLSPRWKPNTRKSAITALRSFLRWSQMCGLCSRSLVEAVPTASAMRSSGVPRHITPAQLDVFLSSFDRSTAAGMRGYAIALCMARLGLRVGQVAQLTLGDFNWREGTVRIAAPKRRRTNTLPLPHEIGAAIVAYIRKGRPRTDTRHVFVSAIKPHEAIGKHAMRRIISDAFGVAGLELPSKGTHVLRHTAATNMMRSGVTIKEIADTLGHSSIDTTGIYAKVDLPTLREVAAPWPKETTR